MNPAESAGTIDEGPFVGLTILLFVISVIAAGWRACIRRQEWKHHQINKHSWEKNQKRTVVEAIQPSWAMNVSWAANKRFEVSEFKTLNSNSGELELTNFPGLVLGYIEAKFCKQILVGIRIYLKRRLRKKE